MNKSIKDIEKELQALHEQKEAIESKLAAIISSTILEVAKEKSIQRVAPNCFIVNLSDLIGNPWNPEFYDWEASVRIVIKFLSSKSVEQWREELIKKLVDRKDKQEPVIFEYRKTIHGATYTDRIPVSPEFVVRIVEKLSE